ncbi:MAG: AsmA family protein, partial [Alphaproteobacteria bacterium]
GLIAWIQNGDMSGLAGWAVKKQGYDVAFDGPVSVQLWPKGTVTVGKVVVMGGNQKPMFETDDAQVMWTWGSGLTPWNGLQVTRVMANNPSLTLVRGKDGVANWDVYASKDEKAEAQADAATTDGGLPLGMLAATQVDILNLNAVYEDATAGQKVVAKGVNLNASTNGPEATTTLNGTVNDQKVDGTLTVDVSNLQDVPLKAKLEAAGLTVGMDGRVREQKSFAGLVNAQTDNLKSTLDALLGKAPEQAPAASFRLGGDVDVGGEKLVFRNFSTRLGELLQASGDAVVNMGDKPSASGNVKMNGNNLRQLAELVLRAPQPNIPASSFDVSTQLAGEDAIELKDLQASLGQLATATGTVKIVPQSGQNPDIDAVLNVSAVNLRALGKAVGQGDSLPAKALNAQANVKGRGDAYDITGLNATLDGVANVKGSGRVVMAAQPEVTGKIAVEGSSVREAAAAFGVTADALPQSAFNIAATVEGKGTIKADDLVINLPQLLEATGKVAVTPGKPLNLVASLNVTRMNLTALGYCAVDVPTETGAPTETAPASNANDAPWTDEKINTEMLRDVAFDVTLNAKGIDCKRVPMETLTARLTNTPSQLDIRQMDVVFKDGGNAKLTGKLEHAGEPVLVLNATTSKLRVENLVPVLATKGVQLPIDTNAGFTSRGDTTRKLVRSLDGTLSVVANEGKLPYTNLLGSASNIASLIQRTSATTASNGNGDVDSLKARYTLRQGVATTDELTVATGNGAMTLKGEGTIDLPNWVLDYKLTPTLNAGSNALAIPVVAKGPLTAPKIGADPAFVSKISGRLAGEALEGVLGKDAGKAVGGVLGGVISGQGISQEGVGSLINAFGGKKTSPTTVSGTSPTTNGKPTVQDLFKAFGR